MTFSSKKIKFSLLQNTFYSDSGQIHLKFYNYQVQVLYYYSSYFGIDFKMYFLRKFQIGDFSQFLALTSNISLQGKDQFLMYRKPLAQGFLDLLFLVFLLFKSDKLIY